MSLKALIVDDEPDLEFLVRQAFRKKIQAGEYIFAFAHNGLEALDLFNRDAEIGIVMADINMPVMDGLTLLERIGAGRRVHRTVIVSAYDDLRNIRTAMNRGAYDFLTKPIDFVDFEATLLKADAEIQTMRQGVSAREQLAALQSELMIARRIQQSMLPRNPAEASKDRFDVYASMVPASEVGGDLYDYFLIDSDHLGFAIGDVSGKGVPAALFMAVTRSLLRATALQGCSAEECLRYMNRVLIGQSDGHMHVTLLYGIVDLNTGELSYCVGGHTPPVVLRADGTAKLHKNARGMMLGIFEEAQFGVDSLVLAPDDILVLYTDGVTEASGPNDTMLGTSGMLKLLNGRFGTPKDLVDHLTSGVLQYTAGEPQSDDITALALRIPRS